MWNTMWNTMIKTKVADIDNAQKQDNVRQNKYMYI